MSALSPNISIIILNINGPNIPIKKETEWQSGLKKNHLSICYLQETHFKYSDIGRLKVKG